MGLGLSIVQRACKHLGHKVGLRSKPGVGSVFSIELPVAPARQGYARTDTKAARVAASELDLIIVVVENDHDVLYATTQRLESWGASVLAAASTQEALDLVAEIDFAPDIILADYQLDGEDNGIKAIEALRKATGESIPADLLQASHEHNFTVLTKPVQLSRLRAVIDWKTRSRIA